MHALYERLPWVLDMTFPENYCRTRTKYAAQNLDMLNKICLHILKKSDMKASFKGKRKAAEWNKTIWKIYSIFDASALKVVND